MHKAVNVPAFLDKYSGFNNDQIDLINNIVRTAYNRWQGKIDQKQLPDSPISNIISQPSWRVTNIRDVNYSGVSEISFDFDTTGMIAGVEYKTIEFLPCKILSYSIKQSGFSDMNSTTTSLLSEYGAFYYTTGLNENENFLSFKANTGEGGGQSLPNINWKVTLICYLEKK